MGIMWRLVLLCGIIPGLSWAAVSDRFPSTNTVNQVRALDHVVAADLDNDNFIDIIGAQYHAQHVVIFQNMKNGEWKEHRVQVTAHSVVRQVAIGDINEDGRPDIVVGGLKGSFNDAFFGWIETCELFTFNFRMFSRERLPFVLVDDFNNDGYDDVVAADGSKIRYHERDQGGQRWATANFFYDSANAPDNVKPAGIREMISADVNGDGLADLVVNAPLLLFTNNGSRQPPFDEPVGIFASTDVGSIATAHVDSRSSRSVDILMTRPIAREIVYLRNVGNDGQWESVLIDSEVDGDFLHTGSVVARDLDKDGDEDIIVFRQDGIHVSYYENLDGRGKFGDRQTIYESDSSVLWTAAVADVDGDTFDDLVLAFHNVGESPEILWMRNQHKCNPFEAIKTKNSEFLRVRNRNQSGVIQSATSIRFACREHFITHSSSELACTGNEKKDTRTFRKLDKCRHKCDFTHNVDADEYLQKRNRLQLPFSSNSSILEVPCLSNFVSSGRSWVQCSGERAKDEHELKNLDVCRHKCDMDPSFDLVGKLSTMNREYTRYDRNSSRVEFPCKANFWSDSSWMTCSGELGQDRGRLGALGDCRHKCDFSQSFDVSKYLRTHNRETTRYQTGSIRSEFACRAHFVSKGDAWINCTDNAEDNENAIKSLEECHHKCDFSKTFDPSADLARLNRKLTQFVESSSNLEIPCKDTYVSHSYAWITCKGNAVEDEHRIRNLPTCRHKCDFLPTFKITADLLASKNREATTFTETSTRIEFPCKEHFVSATGEDHSWIDCTGEVARDRKAFRGLPECHHKCDFPSSLDVAGHLLERNRQRKAFNRSSSFIEVPCRENYVSSASPYMECSGNVLTDEYRLRNLKKCQHKCLLGASDDVLGKLPKMNRQVVSFDIGVSRIEFPCLENFVSTKTWVTCTGNPEDDEHALDDLGDCRHKCDFMESLDATSRFSTLNRKRTQYTTGSLHLEFPCKDNYVSKKDAFITCKGDLKEDKQAVMNLGECRHKCDFWETANATNHLAEIHRERPHYSADSLRLEFPCKENYVSTANGVIECKGDAEEDGHAVMNLEECHLPIQVIQPRAHSGSKSSGEGDAVRPQPPSASDGSRGNEVPPPDTSAVLPPDTSASSGLHLPFDIQEILALPKDLLIMIGTIGVMTSMFVIYGCLQCINWCTPTSGYPPRVASRISVSSEDAFRAPAAARVPAEISARAAERALAVLRESASAFEALTQQSRDRVGSRHRVPMQSSTPGSRAPARGRAPTRGRAPSGGRVPAVVRELPDDEKAQAVVRELPAVGRARPRVRAPARNRAPTGGRASTGDRAPAVVRELPDADSDRAPAVVRELPAAERAPAVVMELPAADRAPAVVRELPAAKASATSWESKVTSGNPRQSRKSSAKQSSEKVIAL